MAGFSIIVKLIMRIVPIMLAVASLTNPTFYSSGFLLKHESESMFSDTTGVFIEPTGVTYPYSDFIYVNVMYYIPKVKIDPKPLSEGCMDSYKRSLDAEIAGVASGIRKELHIYAPEYRSSLVKHTNRTKRLVPLIPVLAGLVALAVGSLTVVNTVQVANLRDQAQSLESSLDQTQSAYDKSNEKINELISKLNTLGSLTVPRIEETVRGMISNNTCSTKIAGLGTKYAYELRKSSDVAVRIINALYGHVVTPDLFPVSKLKTDILARSDMNGSIYHADPMLFYQLTKGFLTSVRHNPFVISAILIIPKLKKEHIGMTISITRVPIMHEGVPMLVDAPELAMIDPVRERIWSVDYDRCSSVAGSHFCPIQAMKKRVSSCLEGLLFKNTGSNCRALEDYEAPTVRHTLEGLLITTHGQSIQKLTLDLDGRTKSASLDYNSSSKCVYIDKSEAPEIMVDGTVYILGERNVNVTAPNKVIVLPTNTTPDYVPSATDDWVNVQPLTPNDWTPVHHHAIGLTTNIILMTGVGSLMIWQWMRMANRVRCLERIIQHP